MVLRAIRGLGDGPPREAPRRAWSLRALATALTLLFFAVLGSAVVTIRDLVEPARPTSSHAPAAPPERVVFVPVPEAQRPPSATPAPTQPLPTTLAPPLRTPAAPERTRITPRDTSASVGSPIAPPPARQRDSLAVAPARGGAGSPTTVESPRLVFPTQPCDLNCEVKRNAAAARGGIPAPLTAVQRDSVRREVARRVTESPRQSSGPVGPPVNTNAVQQHGTSIGIPLPGGGPSAAERKRARELDAEVSARLARIKARADSIEKARRDSIAAAAAAKRQP